MASEGRVAIVTGGNKGMGMSIIRDLVQRGWQVAIADIMENQEFAEELGEKASFFKCDVTDYDRYGMNASQYIEV
jgi:NAD(P)-dependent dehydrogenase (short-subunit alcohol dehydrogenase family)